MDNENPTSIEDSQMMRCSSAYLTAVNTTQIILQDVATVQRNNYILYSTGLGLALKKIADGEPQGQQLLEALEKTMEFDQAYIAKIGNICAEILKQYEKLM